MGAAFPRSMAGRAWTRFPLRSDGETFDLRRLRGDARGARGDWHAADCLLRNGRAKKEVPAELATGEWIGAYCLSERKRDRRAEFADPRGS